MITLRAYDVDAEADLGDGGGPCGAGGGPGGGGGSGGEGCGGEGCRFISILGIMEEWEVVVMEVGLGVRIMFICLLFIFRSL